MPDYLTRAALEARSDAGVVLRLADDDGDNVLGAADLARLDLIMNEAEGLAASQLLRAYPSRDSVRALMLGDEATLGQAAWVALELLSERRPGFASADGWGAYKAQYERAMRHFAQLAKGRISSGATGAANAQDGSAMAQPSPPAMTAQQYEFAPSRDAPRGRGGF